MTFANKLLAGCPKGELWEAWMEKTKEAKGLWKA